MHVSETLRWDGAVQIRRQLSWFPGVFQLSLFQKPQHRWQFTWFWRVTSSSLLHRRWEQEAVSFPYYPSGTFLMDLLCFSHFFLSTGEQNHFPLPGSKLRPLALPTFDGRQISKTTCFIFFKASPPTWCTVTKICLMWLCLCLGFIWHDWIHTQTHTVWTESCALGVLLQVFWGKVFFFGGGWLAWSLLCRTSWHWACCILLASAF